jgi:hypothetical protein
MNHAFNAYRMRAMVLFQAVFSLIATVTAFAKRTKPAFRGF